MMYKRLIPYMVALELISAPISGCTRFIIGTRGFISDVINIPSDLMKSESELATHYRVSLPNGYKTSPPVLEHLTVLAGIIDGSVKVKKDGSGYKLSGEPALYTKPEFAEVCKMADTTPDKVITLEEARDLGARVEKMYFK